MATQANDVQTVAAIDKARKSALAEMTPATREVAKQFEHKLQLGASGVVLINYDLGAQVKEVVEKEDKYGSGAVEQLATYLRIPGGATTLYSMQQFAASFDREYVKEMMAKPMAGGKQLSSTHWFVLSRVEGKGKQKELMKAVLDKGWSAADLEMEIRAGVKTKNARQGGRKPGIPTSPVAGLQKTSSMLLQFNNWEKVAVKHVFDEIDEITPDKVNAEMIKKLDETIKVAEIADTKIEETIKRLKGNRTRAKEVLDQKYALAEKARQEVEGEATPKKGAAAKKTVSKKPQAAKATA